MEALAAAQFGVAPALAAALLHALWQDALLGIVAALTLRALARSSAAARHNAGMAFLMAMLVVPAMQFLRCWEPAGSPLGDVVLATMTHVSLGTASTYGFEQGASPLAAAIVACWLCGVGVMLARHISGLLAIGRMERGVFDALPPQWHHRVDTLRARMGLARNVVVRVSDGVLVPCAARVLRPVVWVPVGLVARAPANQLEALLAHELAHVARLDWVWNGVQCLVESLLFFHPAAWWLGRRIRQEREHACDDLAVAACGDAIALAEALASLERDRRAGSHLALGATGGSLMQRITRLLSGPPSRARWSAAAVLGALALSGALLAVQVSMAGGFLPDLRVSSSTAGPLGPGDWREIDAAGVDGRRFYRAEADGRGHIAEVYKVDGRARPIDANVRRWIVEVSRVPTVPAVPPDVELANRPEFQSLIAGIAAHPAVVAKLGSPARALTRTPNGEVSVRTDGIDGDASLEIPMRGPKGSATVIVEARMHDRRWTYQRVDVQ